MLDDVVNRRMVIVMVAVLMVEGGQRRARLQTVQHLAGRVGGVHFGNGSGTVVMLGSGQRRLVQGRWSGRRRMQGGSKRMRERTVGYDLLVPGRQVQVQQLAFALLTVVWRRRVFDTLR